MSCRFLTALPVFNEVAYVGPVLDEVKRYSEHVLAVNDGSSDGTASLLAERDDVYVVNHAENRGYGAALLSAFDYAIRQEYDVLVTIDCDGQHQPKLIPDFVQACAEADVVSGSRYLREFAGDSRPPADRRAINRRITQDINERLGLSLTDAFCGFKAYRVCALKKLRVQDHGYAMPLELWVQISKLRLRLVELPVPLVYLDESRSFGGALDDADTRLAHYRQVLDQAMREYATLRPAPRRDALCGACEP